MESKERKLREILADIGSGIVAFSGGVGSTLLLRVAYDVLKDKVVAVTAVSPSFPSKELEHAKLLAGR
jgi:uncharacterized protein